MPHNPWKDWRRIYAIVGKNPFHIYNILPRGVPNGEIRKLTAILQTLVYNKKVVKLGHKVVYGKRGVILYQFL